MRHATTIVILAVVLAISLTPAIALRFFPLETSALILVPVWTVIGSKIGVPSESAAGVWIVVSFVLATFAASALLLVLARTVTKSVGGGS